MNFLSYLRQQKGLTIAALAKEIGVHRVVLSRAENGWWTRPPQNLDVKLRAFFGDEWTWDRLMMPVTVAAPGAGDNAPTAAAG